MNDSSVAREEWIIKQTNKKNLCTLEFSKIHSASKNWERENQTFRENEFIVVNLAQK